MIGDVLWQPGPDARATTGIGAFMDHVESTRGLRFDEYDSLRRWSVSDVEGFWAAAWEFLGVRSLRPSDEPAYSAVLSSHEMPGARWFDGSLLNYADHALRWTGGAEAVVAWSQTRDVVRLDRDELRDAVARARAGLIRLGVGRGDRVVAYSPNIPETLIAFLAAASIGAIWSSCAPEFGPAAVIDRFSQIEPTVLVGIDGYRHGAKPIDRRDELAAIAAALPSLRATVLVPYLDPSADRIPGTDHVLTWDALLRGDESAGTSDAVAGLELEFEPVPFDHPLYVLYSSGTTGLPKPIVHGHGGMTLEHLKTLSLHADMGEGDRFSWFTTTGWMMWNYLVSGLLVGATVVMFDGDPGFPDLSALWRFAEQAELTWFGVGAPFLHSCLHAGLRPGEEFDLTGLRAMGSTGAPLSPEGFRWVSDAVGDHVMLSSISGGTDICSAFVGATPIVPVYEGEIPTRYLGAAVECFDAEGRSVIGERGELVVTEPMPCMPVGFWGDDDGSRYRAAYFEDRPGIWSHGDWIELTERGTCIITGRSDATLNRGGVRIGTAEIYRVVEAIDWIADSLIVHLEDSGEASTGAGGGAGTLVLFLVADGALDDERIAALRSAIRSQLSPRHVPDRVVAVDAVPTTLSGKKLEVPVKRVLTGAPIESINASVLKDPAALPALIAAARAAGLE